MIFDFQDDSMTLNELSLLIFFALKIGIEHFSQYRLDVYLSHSEFDQNIPIKFLCA